jgi:hypothetical protein
MVNKMIKEEGYCNRCPYYERLLCKLCARVPGNLTAEQEATTLMNAFLAMINLFQKIHKLGG